MTTDLDGMRRWGYVTIDGVGRVRRGSGLRPRPKPGSVLGLTARGEEIEAVWRRLPGVIETRLRARHPLRLGPWSNVLRVLEDAGAPVPIRDLPRLAGVAKESQAVIIRHLEKSGAVAFEPLQSAACGRQARLTPDHGAHAAASGRRRIQTVLAAFDAGDLPTALAPIVGDSTREGSPLWAGLEPPPGGWRTRVAEPERLPWYPLVTHRGGYPDGS